MSGLASGVIALYLWRHSHDLFAFVATENAVTIAFWFADIPTQQTAISEGLESSWCLSTLRFL